MGSLKISKKNVLCYLTKRINALEKRRNKSNIDSLNNFSIGIFELKVMRAKIEGKVRNEKKKKLGGV